MPGFTVLDKLVLKFMLIQQSIWCLVLVSEGVVGYCGKGENGGNAAQGSGGFFPAGFHRLTQAHRPGVKTSINSY